MLLPVLRLVLCVSALGCLALAMSRHQEAIFGAPLTRARSRDLRICGWCGIVAALLLFVMAKSVALGLVEFTGTISLAAGGVYLMLIILQQRSGTSG